MQSAGPFALTLAFLIPLASPRAMADGPYVSISESSDWQDNVTNAPSGDGIRGAFGIESGVNVAWIRSVDFSTMLSIDLATNADVCTRFSGLDSLSFGPRLELSHKLGLGPFAPVLYAGLEGDAAGFADPERSKIGGALVFGFGQRLDDAFQVLVDGRLGSYDARDIVFTGNYASLSTTLNWDIDGTWRIKFLGGWRNGDAVVNYTAEQSAYGWTPVDANALNQPGAWHYVSTFHEPFVAYRVNARTWSYGAGISPAIGPHTSLALQFAHFDTKGYDRYLNNVVSLSLIHRF
jgi:hypothetical protein